MPPRKFLQKKHSHRLMLLWVVFALIGRWLTMLEAHASTALPNLVIVLRLYLWECWQFFSRFYCLQLWLLCVVPYLIHSFFKISFRVRCASVFFLHNPQFVSVSLSCMLLLVLHRCSVVCIAFIQSVQIVWFPILGIPSLRSTVLLGM